MRLAGRGGAAFSWAVTPARIDAILVFVAVEFAAGAAWLAPAAGEWILPWALLLGSGALLLLALRGLLATRDPASTGWLLLLSFVLHLALLAWLLLAAGRPSGGG